MSTYKKTLAGVLMAVLSAGLLEVFSTLVLMLKGRSGHADVSQPHLYDAFRGYRLNPLYSAPGLGRIHSEDGFRSDHRISREKPPNVIRIVALGGSALYGLGSHREPYTRHRDLRNNETITYHLQNRLNSALKADGRRTRVEVINAAVTGYRTFSHLVYLNSRLLAYDPDWVLTIDGNNDFYGEIVGVDHWGSFHYGSAMTSEFLNRRELPFGAYAFARSLGLYSATLRVVEEISKNWNYNRVLEWRRGLADTTNILIPTSSTGHSIGAGNGVRNLEKHARSTYLRALWQVHRLGLREGYKHIAVLQPQIVLEDQELLHPEDQGTRSLTMREVHVHHELMHRVRKELPRLFAEEGVPFLDLGEIAPFAGSKREALYLDYCHLSPAGSSAMAEGIFRALYPQLLGN